MAALARMRARDRGHIVNVGSALAFIGIPLQAPYCAAKFACRGFFESTRAELLHDRSHVRLSMVHLPAVNTPQFGWCHTTLHRHPQPVPPIYQPEVPAERIVRVALDGRRSTVLGSWNKLLVAAGQIAPGLGNHYAALGAWDSQLTDQPIGPERPNNLRRPVDDDLDAGAHGIFDSQAGGFFDPSFVKSLPATARTFVNAVVGAARDAAPAPALMAAASGGVRGSPIPLTVRALWGSALLLRPRIVLKKIGGRAHPPAAVRVLQVLGARHLLQCIFELPGGRRAVRFGVAVDLLHAASDIGFAAVDDRWRRAALTDAAITLGFVALGIPGARRAADELRLRRRGRSSEDSHGRRMQPRRPTVTAWNPRSAVRCRRARGSSSRGPA